VLTKSKLWPELERVLATVGAELYDVDMPDGDGSTLRVYIKHFAKAVGERVKLTLKQLPGKPGRTVKGRLLSFENDCLQVADEESKQDVSFELSNVSKARIDFLFE
jgi:ribosome maturation factor RimP